MVNMKNKKYITLSLITCIILATSGCIPSGMVVGNVQPDSGNYTITPYTPVVKNKSNNKNNSNYYNDNVFSHYNDIPDMKYIKKCCIGE